MKRMMALAGSLTVRGFDKLLAVRFEDTFDDAGDHVNCVGAARPRTRQFRRAGVRRQNCVRSHICRSFELVCLHVRKVGPARLPSWREIAFAPTQKVAPSQVLLAAF